MNPPNKSAVVFPNRELLFSLCIIISTVCGVLSCGRGGQNEGKEPAKEAWVIDPLEEKEQQCNNIQCRFNTATFVGGKIQFCGYESSMQDRDLSPEMVEKLLPLVRRELPILLRTNSPADIAKLLGRRKKRDTSVQGWEAQFDMWQANEFAVIREPSDEELEESRLFAEQQQKEEEQKALEEAARIAAEEEAKRALEVSPTESPGEQDWNSGFGGGSDPTGTADDTDGQSGGDEEPTVDVNPVYVAPTTKTTPAFLKDLGGVIGILGQTTTQKPQQDQFGQDLNEDGNIITALLKSISQSVNPSSVLSAVAQQTQNDAQNGEDASTLDAVNGAIRDLNRAQELRQLDIWRNKVLDNLGKKYVFELRGCEELGIQSPCCTCTRRPVCTGHESKKDGRSELQLHFRIPRIPGQ